MAAPLWIIKAWDNSFIPGLAVSSPHCPFFAFSVLRFPVLTNTSVNEQTKRKSFFRQKAGEILRSVCYQICSIWAKKSNDSKQMNDTKTSSEAARQKTQLWAFKGTQPDDALFMLLFRLEEVRKPKLSFQVDTRNLAARGAFFEHEPGNTINSAAFCLSLISRHGGFSH